MSLSSLQLLEQMSALPPKPDIRRGKTRAISGLRGPALIYNLISNGQHCRRDRETKPLCGAYIEGQFKFRWADDRLIGNACAFQESSHLNTHLIVGVYQIGPVAHQSSGHRKFAYVINRWNRALTCQLDEPFTPRVEKWIVFDDYAGNSFLNQERESAVYFRVSTGPDNKRFSPHSSHCESKVFDSQAALNSLDIGKKANYAARRGTCDSKPSRFPVSSPLIRSTPVMFAPGWLRLATTPSVTESPATNVIGIDIVTDFAARAEGAPPAATKIAG